jgi:hypothetical protein
MPDPQRPSNPELDEQWRYLDQLAERQRDAARAGDHPGDDERAEAELLAVALARSERRGDELMQGLRAAADQLRDEQPARRVAPAVHGEGTQTLVGRVVSRLRSRATR